MSDPRVVELLRSDTYRVPLAEFEAAYPGDGTTLADAPATLGDVDPEKYRYYVNHSCDLTMRGGTTSGVVYPLAACELATHYRFRSVGGASAGAIAASACAAAELGRILAEAVDEKNLDPDPAAADSTAIAASRSGAAATPSADGHVQPGFAGLAEIVMWLTGPDDREEWRLAQLFQPSVTTRPLYRLLAASMQSATKTYRSKARCLAVAALAAVGPLSRTVMAVLLILWALGPALSMRLLPPESWTNVPGWAPWTMLGLAALGLIMVVAVVLSTTLIGRLTRAEMATRGRDVRSAPITRFGVAAVAVAPLVILAGSVLLGPVSWASTRFGLPNWTAIATALLWWLVLTLAMLMGLVLTYGLAMTRFLVKRAGNIHFGLVPGMAPEPPRSRLRGLVTEWINGLCGMPKYTTVPPLSVWLADCFDDLAGFPANPDGPRHALTFGDLWLGQLATDRDERALRLAAKDLRSRVVNLELMTTNLAQQRPYRLPFTEYQQTELIGAAPWLFCRLCLAEALPARVVDQLVAASPAEKPDARCPMHTGTELLRLPQPWHVPVVLAARMSMALPGLISAVPLYTISSGEPRVQAQWFSDGGITSNFPIHFFDSLLPRWPTFGLNLQSVPTPQNGDPLTVQLPEQDDSPSTEPSRDFNSITGFLGAILDTFLDWRDTMQSALPGFRGRIANVPFRPDEGGMNLFMTRETIELLALRGRDAGKQLRERFTTTEGGSQTQTDRYRWIRMRLALRKYRELSQEAGGCTQLYTQTYSLPAALGGWWGRPGEVIGDDPLAQVVTDTIAALAELAQPGKPLRHDVTGGPPVNPNLRLTPPE